jgi:hypothetical protein
VGAPTIGGVFIYDYFNTTGTTSEWVRHTPIYGTGASSGTDGAGASLSLTQDGNRLVVGAPKNDANKGEVRVYGYKTNNAASSPTIPPTASKPPSTITTSTTLPIAGCLKKGGKCKRTRDCCKGHCVKRKCLTCLPRKSKCSKSSECCGSNKCLLDGTCTRNKPRQGKKKMKQNNNGGGGPGNKRPKRNLRVSFEED